MGGGAGWGKMIEVAPKGFVCTVYTVLPQCQARAAHLRRHVCQKGNASDSFFSPEKNNGTQVKNKPSIPDQTVEEVIFFSFVTKTAVGTK